MYDVQVSQCPIAATLAMQYTLQTAKNKDKTGIMRVLGVLAQNIKGNGQLARKGREKEKQLGRFFFFIK